MPRFYLVLLTAFGAAACSPTQAVFGDPATDDPDVQGARFVGTWLVEETVAHATYFAATWRMDADGGLQLVEDHSIGDGLGYPSVSWAGDAYVVCVFGERWTSSDDVVLSVVARCNDDIERTVDLRFSADSSGDADGISPEALSVDGEQLMWREPVWGWRFFKCEGDEANCDPWRPRGS
ncbi:MAG: hypothetical protein ACI9MC_003781 [Kiritimatiellia bacterium]|jgi:hypothetical protein